MTPIERAARALHDRTVHVRRVRDCEHPQREPVERVVAGTPWDDLTEQEREKRRDDVRAVIAAIREPSEGMEDAAEAVDDPHAYGYSSAGVHWPAMIDALLAEGR